MSSVFALAAIFILLIASVYNGISVIYPLTAGLFILTVLAVYKGFRIKDILAMILNGGLKSLNILKIFVLIGAMISVWMAGGTIAFVVYYGVKLINPSYFILSAFIISCIVSFLLGTSFGTTGTIGITLMILAKSGNVSINLAAGAIIAGAYFGDRCSPMSSSANLVAGITETDLYKNIGNMVKTSIIPFALSVIIYLYQSLNNPLNMEGSSVTSEISDLFNINIWVAFPAVIILMLALFRVDVKLSMCISIISAMFLAMVFQKKTIWDIASYALYGYTAAGEGYLGKIIQGGGIFSMLKLSFIVFISSAYSGVLEGTQLLNELEKYIKAFSSKHGLFLTTMLTAIATACFGSTQALAVILTNQLVKKVYSEDQTGRYDLAVSLENTAVVIAPLIPWNIAGAVPAAILSADAGFAFYAHYLYLIPLVCLLSYRFNIFGKIRPKYPSF